jgi:hypothetical protein
VNKSILYNWQLKSLGKNIITTIVALALLIGSTGFQVYKHICSTHNFSAVSIIGMPECEKDHRAVEETDNCCKSEVEEIAEPSCCESEPIDESNSVSIISQELKCCISYVQSNQIQDNLFAPIEKKIFNLELTSTLSPFFENKLQPVHQKLVLHNNDLPPPIFGKQLLQIIHQLKIDTPIS